MLGTVAQTTAKKPPSLLGKNGSFMGVVVGHRLISRWDDGKLMEVTVKSKNGDLTFNVTTEDAAEFYPIGKDLCVKLTPFNLSDISLGCQGDF